MIKKLFVGMFLLIFLVGSVSAFEFDNVKQYDPVKKEITITNLFGLGKELAKIQLTSPTVNYVDVGEEVMVAELHFLSFDDSFNGAFKKMQFYNVNSGNKKIQRFFEYKYRNFVGTEQIPIYASVCPSGDKNEICKFDIVGSRTQNVYEWVEFNAISQLPSQDIVIGIFTETNINERIEWIPTWFGVEINEWAVFDTGLVGYWKLDDDSTDIFNEVNGTLNGTSLSANPEFPGVINTAYNFSGLTNTLINLTDLNGLTNQTSFSYSIWFNQTGLLTVGAQQFISLGTTQSSLHVVADSLGIFAVVKTKSGDIQTANVNFSRNEFHHVVVTYNSSTLNLYINGTLFNTTFGGDTNVGDDLKIGNGNPPSMDRQFKGVLDEFGFWSRAITQEEVTELFNSGLGKSFSGSRGTITVTLIDPENNIISLNSTLNFTANIEAGSNFNNTNATVWIFGSDGSVFNNSQTNDITSFGPNINQTNITVTSLKVGNYTWNILGCGLNLSLDLICKFTDSNRSFILGAINTSSSFNSTVFETGLESFFEDVTIPDGSEISSVEIIWNGTSRSATSTLNSGDNYTLSHSFNIPLIDAASSPNTFSWNITYSNGVEQAVSKHSQAYEFINLTICGAVPQDVPFINFTYKNETAPQEVVSAFVPNSEWTYWLQDQNFNKTLSFSDASESNSHAFCFSPADRTVNIQNTYAYKNAEAQQRTFSLSSSALTNVTNNIILYLLPTSSGVFRNYRTVTNLGSVVKVVFATVTKVIGGSTVTISSGFTDDTGLIAFFLNPDDQYTFLFTKIGFLDNLFSQVPSSADTTTVIMGGIASTQNGSTINVNTTFSILPINSTLVNGTDYLFEFNYTSTQDIQAITMNISLVNGSTLFFGQSTTTSISTILNTNEYERMIGRFVANTTDETFEFSNIWIVGDFFVGDYSLQRQLTLFNDYGFSDSIRILIVLIIIISSVIFLSNTEVLDSSESKIAVVVILVWMFSIISWLDVGLVASGVSTRLTTLTSISSQYGIAILTSFVGFVFIFRRFLIR